MRITSISKALILLILATSCVSKRQIAEIKNKVAEQKNIENQLFNRITKLEEKRVEKNALGELDDRSNMSIQKIIDGEKNAVIKKADSLIKIDEMLSSNKRIKVKDFRKIVTVISIYNDEVKDVKTETLDFIENLFNQKTFIKFNSAAFFGPGGYKIPDEKMEEAKNVFSPIVDSLLVFIKKYPKINLSSSIVSSGYADGQGFSEGELVNQLTANLNKALASKEELNAELSRLRAEEVLSILMQIYKNKIQNIDNQNKFQTDFFAIGKGEEFPNKKITNYQTDDERRRIVVIYWNSLPKD